MRGVKGLTVRELAAALAARPPEEQGLLVFSTADWDTVAGVRGVMEGWNIDGKPVVEIQ